jgi:hypothetical protein
VCVNQLSGSLGVDQLGSLSVGSSFVRATRSRQRSSTLACIRTSSSSAEAVATPALLQHPDLAPLDADFPAHAGDLVPDPVELHRR